MGNMVWGIWCGALFIVRHAYVVLAVNNLNYVK